MHPGNTTGTRPEDGCVAADEIGMRLGLSRQTATGIVSLGVAFTTTLYETGQALASGAITPGTAQVLTRRLTDVPPRVAQDAEEQVLPRAPARTVSQLSRDVERALVRIDTAGAADRGSRPGPAAGWTIPGCCPTG